MYGLEIPNEDYTDGVREILNADVHDDYNSFIVKYSTEELNTCREILIASGKCTQKLKFIEAELKRRKLPETLGISDTKFVREFSEEWEKVTRMFKRK